MKKGFATLAILALIISFVACKKKSKEDPTPENPQVIGGGDEEIITRVNLTFTDSASTSTKFTAAFREDPDGNGPLKATVDTIKLSPNKVYLAKVVILDETKSPVDTVSSEIQEEANYHRFHFTFVSSSGAPGVVTTITDTDAQSPAQPLGLQFKLKTGSNVGMGTFQVNLRHFANGVPKTADPNDGEQDLSVDFPVRIGK